MTPTDDNGRRVGASTAVLLGLASALVALIVGPAASAHSDPCHASHSCPSRDHHSYAWTDAGGRSWDCARTSADEYEPARDTQTIVDDGLYHLFPGRLGRRWHDAEELLGVVTSAVISHVVDGDTVDLTSGARVRLVQIDTPEVYNGVECYGPQASAVTKRLLPVATKVKLLLDPAADSIDRYGRLLRYVVRGADGVNVNLRLVRTETLPRTSTTASGDGLPRNWSDSRGVRASSTGASGAAVPARPIRHTPLSTAVADRDRSAGDGPPWTRLERESKLSPMPPIPTRYTDPRAHELRDRYLATYGGDEIPVPVESIAEDFLGLRIEEEDQAAARRAASRGAPDRRQRLGGHERRHPDSPQPLHDRPRARPLDLLRGDTDRTITYCRAKDLSQDADRALEREANVFGAELLMPEAAVREAWAAFPIETSWRSASASQRSRRSGAFTASTSRNDRRESWDSTRRSTKGPPGWGP